LDDENMIPVYVLCILPGGAFYAYGPTGISYISYCDR